MSKVVIAGAKIKCSMGTAPSTLAVTSQTSTSGEHQGIATVKDHLPNTNIMPFGLCQSLANPQVAAATAAANGTLTPQPCVPVTSSPWAPGSQLVVVARYPALTEQSKCPCQWAGVIEVLESGTEKLQQA